MFLLSIIPMGAIIIAGPWLFSFVFGAQWHDAGNYARSLSIMIVIRFISTPIMHCLDVLEKQSLQLSLNIIRVLFVLLIFKLCVHFGFSSRMAIHFYSIVFSLFYAFVIAIVFKLLFSMKHQPA